MVRYLYLLLFFCFFNTLWAQGRGVETGISIFKYAEVGVNNKDDLYTITSVLAGGFFTDSLEDLSYKISLKTNLPFFLNVEDALGPDNTNYMETLLGVGGNLQYSLYHPITIKNNISLSPGLSLNYDFFYLMDRVPGIFKTYIYSVFGSGPSMELAYSINEKLKFIFNTTYIFNFFPLSFRNGNFLWSNNLFITFGFIFL